jgi:hypothetical protein
MKAPFIPRRAIHPFHEEISNVRGVFNDLLTIGIPAL